MAFLKVWCLLIDHEKKAVFGDVFDIEVHSGAYISDLKKKVKEERPVDLEHVDAARLTVWRCMNPKLLVRPKLAQLKKDLSNVDFIDETKTEELGAGQEIMTLDLSRGEILLVQGPEQNKAIAVTSAADNDEDHTLLLLPPVNSRVKAVTLDLSYRTSDSQSMILNWTTADICNGYEKKRELDDKVGVVVRKLRRAAIHYEASANHLWNCYQSMYPAETMNSTPCLLTDDKSATPYAIGNHEMIHYVQASSLVTFWERREDSLTFDDACFIVINGFKFYWLRMFAGAECNFGGKFPFPLIVQMIHETRVVGLRKYEPKPDATFSVHRLPLFLVEFDSFDNRQDQGRLRVEMACVLRLASDLLDSVNTEKLFLMGAFITKGWEIVRYFAYFSGGGKICFHEETYSMREVEQLMTFLFEFYNYAEYVKDELAPGDKSNDIGALVKEIDDKGYKSLYTRGTNKSKKRPQPEGDQDDTNNGSNEGPSKRIHTAMVMALQASGYEARNSYSEEGLKPLVELPDHVVEGTRTRDGEMIVAKLVRKEELSLLQKLSSRKSPHNHVIPLLDTVQSSLGPLIILPLATPLMLPALFWKDIEQLSRELVEGVAFLHRQKIAHLDIKPANLVCSLHPKRLYIIDFDIAIQCEDVDEMVETSCGTPEWSAPEIVLDSNKPLRAFNPIRADLWSCGKVLQSFRRVASREDEEISLLMELLMSRDPRCRPLLHEVVDEEPDFWSSGRLMSHLITDGVRRTMMENVIKRTKRTRDDAAEEGLVSKQRFLSKAVTGLLPHYL